MWKKIKNTYWKAKYSPHTPRISSFKSVFIVFSKKKMLKYTFKWKIKKNVFEIQIVFFLDFFSTKNIRSWLMEFKECVLLAYFFCHTIKRIHHQLSTLYYQIAKVFYLTFTKLCRKTLCFFIYKIVLLVLS